MPGNKLKISIGPVQHYWSRNELLDFYADIAKSAADIVYLGETVCSKRRTLRTDDWITLAQQLRDCDKEVVLSTLTLIEAESELNATKHIIENGEFITECNDMAAVNFCIERKLPFITGPAINIYNANTLAFLIDRGLKRWVPCVELSRESIKKTLGALPNSIETEIFAYGFLPLAYSARCFTARQYQLPKDNCQFMCLQHPQGIVLSTQDNNNLFRINGIQTQSYETCNLLPLYDDMVALGVHSLRLSLSHQSEIALINQLDQIRHSQHNTIPLLNTSGINGYWFGKAGMLVGD